MSSPSTSQPAANRALNKAMREAVEFIHAEGWDAPPTLFALVPTQLVNADGLAIAPGLVALELVVRVVRLSVLRQVRRLAKALAADLALERLLARVRAYVHSYLGSRPLVSR